MSRGYKKFLWLWFGQLISSIGGGLTSFGLTVYVFSQTGSATSTSIVALLAFLPNLLLGMPSGVLADRMDRRVLMMLGDGLSALGLVYILVAMHSGQALYWQICVGVSISSIFSALMEPAYKATVTDLLSEEEYIQSSGLVSLAGSARYLLSPVLAGLLLTITSIETLLIIDICTFFLTVIVTAMVRNTIHKQQTNTSSFIEDMKMGWQVVCSNQGVLTLIVIVSFMTFCMGAMQILAEPMILSFSSSKVLGIVETICASGMVVTGILLGIYGMKKNIVVSLCISLACMGLFMIGFGWMENLVVIGITGFLFFMMLPIANSSFDFLIRTNIANEVQGRVWGLVGFISQLGYVFAYGFCGILSDCMAHSFSISVGRGSGSVIILAGIVLILLSVILYINKNVRQLEAKSFH